MQNFLYLSSTAKHFLQLSSFYTGLSHDVFQRLRVKVLKSQEIDGHVTLDFDEKSLAVDLGVCYLDNMKKR